MLEIEVWIFVSISFSSNRIGSSSSEQFSNTSSLSPAAMLGFVAKLRTTSGLEPRSPLFFLVFVDIVALKKSSIASSNPPVVSKEA